MLELIIILVLVAGVAVWWFNRDTGADVDQDGDVDLNDAKAAVKKTVKGVNKAAAKATKKK
jgi:hypothetical protein